MFLLSCCWFDNFHDLCSPWLTWQALIGLCRSSRHGEAFFPKSSSHKDFTITMPGPPRKSWKSLPDKKGMRNE
jgi:hypothetical protein